MATRSTPAASKTASRSTLRSFGQAVRAHLREIGGYADQSGRRFRVAVRDQSLAVRVGTPRDLPIAVGGVTETAVSAT